MMVVGRNKVGRRTVLAALLALPFVKGRASAASGEGSSLRIKVFKDANCGCCEAWIRHMRDAGFKVSSTDVEDMDAIKKRLGVPEALSSCHTAQVDGLIVEGHVPAEVVNQLLVGAREGIRGVSAPGTPVGSPGMETDDGKMEAYDIVLFGTFGTEHFARCIGDKKI